MPGTGVARIAPNETSLRVLIMTPQGRDAALAEDALSRAGLSTCICGSDDELRREIADGAGCVLIAEEALPRDREGSWNDWYGPEPAWSLLPVVALLGRGGAQKNLPLLRKIEKRPNISFIERPTPRRTLISALKTALEARRLQYAIRDALDALQSSNRRKDEFLAVLSHELRNPLAPIRNAIYVLHKLDCEDRTSKERLHAMLPMMGRQVDHLVHLVDDLLEMSRITTGKIVLRRADTDLEKILRQSIEFAEPLIRASKHELRVSLPEQDLLVFGDAVRLTQVFANLLNNAAKYTPPGGRIELRARREADVAVLSVRDNGVGIAASMLPKVFELFAQSARGDGRADGLGIGLAIVRKLVEMHGGYVSAHSAGEGCGSEFIVRLPLAAAPNLPSGDADASRQPHSSGHGDCKMTDKRLQSPSTLRNRAAILDVLRTVLPARGVVLEVASGSGEHVLHFAANLPGLTFAPSDASESARDSIAAWVGSADVKNVRAPLALDATHDAWPIDRADAIICINMIHIAPWAATEGLVSHAAALLPTGAPLYLYGPYKRGGAHTAPSNAEFEGWLKSQNPEFGVRDIEAVAALAARNGFGGPQMVEMPANNLSVIFRR